MPALVSPEGIITIFATADPAPDYIPRLYTLVSFDGGESFLGPFVQTPEAGGSHDDARFADLDSTGAVHATWLERLPTDPWWWPASVYYGMSNDSGVSFTYRKLVMANDPDHILYAGPALAVSAPGLPSVIDSLGYYTECGR
ncbi:MAG: hypothetical protein AB1486_10295 [Planctomycetota bacterium]